MARFVDRLPLPSKTPVNTTCHWFNGNRRLLLFSRLHEPPANPFVAEMAKVAPVTPNCEMCGELGVTLPTVI